MQAEKWTDTPTMDYRISSPSHPGRVFDGTRFGLRMKKPRDAWSLAVYRYRLANFSIDSETQDLFGTPPDSTETFRFRDSRSEATIRQGPDSLSVRIAATPRNSGPVRKQ